MTIPLISDLSAYLPDIQEFIMNNFKILSPSKVAVFNKSHINFIRESFIEKEYRFLDSLDQFSNYIEILEFKMNSNYEKLAYEISKIASKEDFSENGKLRYQKLFKKLVFAFFNYYNLDNNHTDYLVLLRSGKFVAVNGFNTSYEKRLKDIHWVETKRLDKKSLIAFSKMPRLHKDNDEIIILDAGIVSGLSIASLLVYLGHIPDYKKRKITVYSIFSSWYGLLNLHWLANELNLNLKTIVFMISYSINDDLRAIKKYRNETLKATADVGEFLYPIMTN